ncbi:MAG: hypothetical protein WCL18_09115 [bacterium]
MKKTIIIILCYLAGYQGYAQNKSVTLLAFYPKVPDTLEWTEQEIIDIIEEGKTLYCKIDMFVERNDTNFYAKNMEILFPENSVFDAVYLESSVFYGSSKKDQINMHCDYLIINIKNSKQWEITEEEVASLAKLSKYLDEKIKKEKLKECDEKHSPLD